MERITICLVLKQKTISLNQQTYSIIKINNENVRKI